MELDRTMPNQENSEDLSSKTCEELLATGDLISLKQAARLSGYSYNYLNDIAGKRLCAKKIDAYWVTTLAAVTAYTQSRSHKLKKDIE